MTLLASAPGWGETISLPPSEHHTAWIAAYWQFSVADNGPEVVEFVTVPDGNVSLELLAHGDSLELRFVGPSISPRTCRADRGTRYICARLRPGAALAFLAPPIDRFIDAVHPLGELCPEMNERLLAGLRGTTPDIHALAAALSSEIAHWDLPDHIVGVLADRIIAARGVVELGDELGSFGMTPRHIRRRFCEAMGFNPKTFAQLQRSRCDFGKAMGVQDSAPIMFSMQNAA